MKKKNNKENNNRNFCLGNIMSWPTTNINMFGVVATTRQNGTRSLLTSAKLSVGYLVVCYDLKLQRLSNKTTLVLSNTRELDRVPSTE